MTRMLVGLLVLGCGLVVGWSVFESDPSTVHITAEEFRFVPAMVELSAFQDVQFVIRNQGRERHVFTSSFFRDQTILIMWGAGDRSLQDGVTVNLSPGKSVSFRVKLPPGHYPYRCVVQGHRGMEGMLVVRSEYD